MDTLRIMQRLHSPFYAPQFVAISLGGLAEEDLQVEFHTATSGLALRQQLLSGAMHLGLSGPLGSLELAAAGRRERLVSITRPSASSEHVDVRFAQAAMA